MLPGSLRSRLKVSADALAVAGLVLLVLLVFRSAVFGGLVFFDRDVAVHWYPRIEAFVRAIGEGSWPVWDPTVAFGQPLIGDPVQLMYPPAWANLILPPWIYYTFQIVAHMLLATLGLYALARRFRLSAPAAFVASALWTLSGPLLSLVNLWHHFTGVSWAPVVFLAAERALTSGRAASALVWGLAVAAQFLANSPDMSLYTLLALAVWILCRHVEWRAPCGAQNRRVLLLSAVALVLALGFTAPLWGTVLDVVAHSARQQLSERIRAYWSVHPLGLIELVVGGLWTDLPLSRSFAAALFESREPFLASLYLGFPSLALVAVALAGPRHPFKRFAVAAIMAAGLFALGRHAPFYTWVTKVLPPLQMLRFPVKVVPLLALFWALLAGLGVDGLRVPPGMWRPRARFGALTPLGLLALLAGGLWLLTRSHPALWASALDASLPPSSYPTALAPVRQRLLVTAGLAVAALLVTAIALRGRRVAAGILCLLVLGDLGCRTEPLIPLAPRAFYSVRPEVVDLLRATPSSRAYIYDYHLAEKAVRYLKRTPAYELGRVPPGWSPRAALALGAQLYLAPETVARWGLRSGFEMDYHGTYPAPLQLLTVLLREVEGTPNHLRLLRLGGVTHVVALHEEGFQDLTPVAVFQGLFSWPIRVFAVPHPQPRAYAVAGAWVGEDPAALLDPDFDPAREVLLTSGRPLMAPPAFEHDVRIVEAKSDRVRLTVQLSHPAYVVLLDGYDPGWRAQVDGRAAEILRANLAFRAVRVEAGRHVIDYVYRPRGLFYGLAGFGLAFAAAVAIALRARFAGAASRPQRPAPSAS